MEITISLKTLRGISKTLAWLLLIVPAMLAAFVFYLESVRPDHIENYLWMPAILHLSVFIFFSTIVILRSQMDVVEKVVLPNIKLFLVVVFLIPVAFSLFFNQDISSVILAVDGDRYLYLKRFKPTLEISYDRFFDLLMFQAWGALGISTPFIWITFSLLISLAKFEK